MEKDLHSQATKLEPGHLALSHLLLRADQEFGASAFSVIASNNVGIQGFGERDFIRVMAGEGGFKFLGYARAQAITYLHANFGQEVREQPATNTPSHAIATRKFAW